MHTKTPKAHAIFPHLQKWRANDERHNLEQPNKNKKMKRIFPTFAVMLTVLMFATSCLDDDESQTVYPSDAAITAFTLGNLNCYHTTKSSTGADSTYKTTVVGSTYPFYIDQINHVIYNPDSLPYGTDVAHVLCTITSKNSGSITIKNVDSDTLKFYNSSDSIDFTVPRQISVFSMDGSNRADYTVRVNVHQEAPDNFIWHSKGSNLLFNSAVDMKALTCGDKLLVFVDNGNYGTICSTSLSDGETWAVEGWNANKPVPASACRNVVEKGGVIYLYTRGEILRTTDGSNWELAANANLDRLVAASSTRLYAFDKTGNMVSSADDGQTWDVEALDTDMAFMPTQDLSYSLQKSRVNPLNENVVLVGNRATGTYFDDKQAHVWSKLIDTSDTSNGEPWMYLNPNDVDTLALPRLSPLATVGYDGGILAVGGHGIGACTTEGFTRFYFSYDGGIYWNLRESFTLPEGFACGSAFTMAADSDNYLWLICGQSGQVWKGRLSGTSGTNNQTSFTK